MNCKNMIEHKLTSICDKLLEAIALLVGDRTEVAIEIASMGGQCVVEVTGDDEMRRVSLHHNLDWITSSINLWETPWLALEVVEALEEGAKERLEAYLERIIESIQGEVESDTYQRQVFEGTEIEDEDFTLVSLGYAAWLDKPYPFKLSDKESQRLFDAVYVNGLQYEYVNGINFKSGTVISVHIGDIERDVSDEIAKLMQHFGKEYVNNNYEVYWGGGSSMAVLYNPGGYVRAFVNFYEI